MGGHMAAVPESTEGQSPSQQAVKDGRTWGEFLRGVGTGVAATIILAMIAVPALQYFLPPPETDVTLPRFQVMSIKEGPLAGSAVVRYIGSISKPGVVLIRKELEKLSSERSIWLSMESGGGDIEAEDSLLDYINSTKVGLVIPGKAQCASACTLMYAWAERKFAFPDAYFGFHYAVKSTTLSSSSLFTITHESDIPTTTKKILELLTNKVPDRHNDLAAFFDSCSKGNPTYSRRVVYLSWEQIKMIVQGDNGPVCDVIAGQDSNWFLEQVSPLQTLSKGTD